MEIYSIEDAAFEEPSPVFEDKEPVTDTEGNKGVIVKIINDKLPLGCERVQFEGESVALICRKDQLISIKSERKAV